MKSIVLVAAITLLSLMFLTQGSARVLWFSDFEPDGKTKSFPRRANNPDNWNLNAENRGTIWNTTNQGGSRALTQTAEGCGISGNTPIPGSPQFSDGIIDLEMSWGDDDSVGVTFRASGAGDSWDRGYLVVFGYNETVALILHDMAKGCTFPGHCLNNDANNLEPQRKGNDHCDLGGGRTSIKTVRLNGLDFEVGGVQAGIVEGGRGKLPQDNRHFLFGRIRAIGRQIDVWYGEIDKVNPETIAAGLEPIMRARDHKYEVGEVGIWHESWKNGIIDNITITDGAGFAVDAKGKLAVSWGAIKASY